MTDQPEAAAVIIEVVTSVEGDGSQLTVRKARIYLPPGTKIEELPAPLPPLMGPRGKVELGPKDLRT